MTRPNPDAFKTVEKTELGVVGDIMFELQVWSNDRGSRWVLMMYGQEVREHTEVTDRTAAMLLRNKMTGDS